MVVLSPNFAILASLSALAVVSMLPAAEAVAIPSQDNNQGDTSLNGQSSSSANAKGAQDSPGSITPVLPLPGLSKRRVVAASHGKSDVKEHKLEERWNPLDPLLQLGDIWIGTGSRPAARSDGDDVVVSGDNDHVHVSKHHRGDDRVVVKGDDQHVHVHRRTPEPRRHHYHHDKTVVNGDHDHVNIHEKRTSRRHRHHHHHGHHRRSSSVHGLVAKRDDGDASDVSVPLLDKDRTLLVPASTQRRRSGPLGDTLILDGDAGDLVMGMKRQLGDAVILDGNGEDLVMVTKRQLSTMSAFAEPEGVPGTIDIVSNVDGSPVGERIASLVLSSVMGDSVLKNPDPFMLNASGTNQTQIYLVVLPDDVDSSNSTSPDPSSNSTSSTYPANNSTSSSNTTASSAASQTFAPMNISNSTAPADSSSPSNSTLPGNSTSSSDSTDSAPAKYRKVALKIPLFDAESATMKAYCATFDPQPTAPSPLTVESCSDGPMVQEHKSQIFAYDPATGAIQPMWYDGDGTPDGDDGDDSADFPSGDGSGDIPDDGSDDAAPPADDPSTPANVTSTADVDNTVARIASLSDRLMNNDALIQPPAPSMAAKAHAFAAEPYPNAQNVTLMFTPATPELSSQAADEEQLASSSSSSFSTSTATPSSTSPTPEASTTGTDSYSSFSSTATPFFPASATSATASSIASSSSTDFGSASTTVTFSPASSAPTDSSSSASSSATATSADSGSTAVSLSPASAMPSASSSTPSATVTDSSSSAATSTPTSSADASATSSAISSDATASATHSLAVEVFDPNATATPSTSGCANATATASGTDSSAAGSATDSCPVASATSTSTSGSLGAQAARTSSSSSSSSTEPSSSSSTVPSGASSTDSSSTPSMTPFSTAPYEWMFKQGLKKRGYTAAYDW